MGIKFSNNASAQLASSINTSTTSIVVQNGQGALFPPLSAGDYFYATLVDVTNNLEIVKVTARAGDSLTVTRAQDSTIARSYSAGDVIELRPVAGALADIVVDKVSTSGAQTIGGEKTFSNLLIRGGSADPYFQFGTTTTASSYGRFHRGGTTTDAGYIGTDGGAILGGGTGTKFGIRSTGELLLISDTGVITATGNFTASGTVTENSDERLKSDIQTIQNALDKVKQLRGASYVKDGKQSIGVIAQEVEAVVPEVVFGGSDDYKSVAYGNLVGLLVEAVKELSAKVEALEEK